MAGPHRLPCETPESYHCGRDDVASRGLRWVLPATILGSSMSFIDCSVVNVALPAMQRSFATDFGMLQWVMNGYLLALASLILLGGAAGDRHLGCGRCLHDRTRAAARRLARRYGRLAFNFLPQRADRCCRTVVCAQASTGPADGPIGAHGLLRRHAGNFALVFLTFGLVSLAERALVNGVVAVLCALPAAWMFIRHEACVTSPMMPLSLFHDRSFKRWQPPMCERWPPRPCSPASAHSRRR